MTLRGAIEAISETVNGIGAAVLDEPASAIAALIVLALLVASLS